MAVLGSADLVAFVPTTNLERATGFFRNMLGLTLVEESPIAVVFDAHGTRLRVTLVERSDPAAFTVLGWIVPDIAGGVGSLTERGVVFERFPGMDQDDQGVWTAPGGAKVAWFKDPDGNVLSLTEM